MADAINKLHFDIPSKPQCKHFLPYSSSNYLYMTCCYSPVHMKHQKLQYLTIGVGCFFLTTSPFNTKYNRNNYPGLPTSYTHYWVSCFTCNSSGYKVPSSGIPLNTKNNFFV